MAIANLDAKRANQDEITPVNVLFGLLAQQDSVACHVLVASGVTPDDVLRHIARTSEIPILQDKIRLPADRATHCVVNESIRVSLSNQHNAVGTEHLLVALARSDCQAMQKIKEKFQLNDLDLNNTAILLLAGARDIPDSILGRMWLSFKGQLRRVLR